MKTKTMLLAASLGLAFSLGAQSFDLTTGQGPVGTNDPVWTVQLPSGGAFNPVPISTGLINGNAAYTQNNCGRWISPHLDANNDISIVGIETGSYTYRTQFSVDPCLNNPQATLNLTHIIADNSVALITVNGIPQAFTGPTAHNTAGGSALTNPIVNAGINTIDVVVNNPHVYTAFKLCGDITITGNVIAAPTDLGCCDAEAGQVLSWSPVPGAIDYEIEFIWNDPDCCPQGDLPTATRRMTGGSNVFIMLPGDPNCFSWKVRAITSNGEGCFSEKMCSCAPVIIEKCEKPVDLNCEIDGNGRLLLWNPVAGAASYQIEVIYNDPACCEGTGLPFGTIFISTDPKLFVNDLELCFSWRVRTVCENGNTSAWSDTKCSCPSGKEKIGNSINASTTNFGSLEVSVVPNPAKDFVTINISNKENTAELNNTSIVIVDLSGKQIHQSSISANESNKLDVSGFESGIYLYKIMSEGVMIHSNKLVIQK